MLRIAPFASVFALLTCAATASAETPFRLPFDTPVLADATRPDVTNQKGGGYRAPVTLDELPRPMHDLAGIVSRGVRIPHRSLEMYLASGARSIYVPYGSSCYGVYLEGRF